MRNVSNYRNFVFQIIGVRINLGGSKALMYLSVDEIKATGWKEDKTSANWFRIKEGGIWLLGAQWKLYFSRSNSLYARCQRAHYCVNDFIVVDFEYFAWDRLLLNAIEDSIFVPEWIRHSLCLAHIGTCSKVSWVSSEMNIECKMIHIHWRP